jgi:hypothetical protein
MWSAQSVYFKVKSLGSNYADMISSDSGQHVASMLSIGDMYFNGEFYPIS